MSTGSALVAVTGASGHMGSNLLRALLDRGHRVRAVVPAPARSLRGLDVEVASADVRHPETLRAVSVRVFAHRHRRLRARFGGEPGAL